MAPTSSPEDSFSAIALPSGGKERSACAANSESRLIRIVFADFDRLICMRVLCDLSSKTSSEIGCAKDGEMLDIAEERR